MTRWSKFVNGKQKCIFISVPENEMFCDGTYCVVLESTALGWLDFSHALLREKNCSLRIGWSTFSTNIKPGWNGWKIVGGNCCRLLRSLFTSLDVFSKQKQNGKLLVLFQCAQYRSNGKICKHANRRKAAEIAQHFENWLPSVYPESEHR